MEHLLTPCVSGTRHTATVRASRLISILLLLQARGRMTADALARELEVSVRTVYRDIEALHLSGVALYGEAGRDGGYRLLDGYRTQLTGLTPAEAAALPLAALPAAARSLGLGSAAAGAAAKLKAALSDDLRARADHVQDRLYLDPVAWYDDAESTPLLAEVADAVWRQQRLRVTYRRWRAPSEVERTLDPYGLVLKGGRWYVVALAHEPRGGGPRSRAGGRPAEAGGPRTYRVSQLLAATPTGERFDRPADFDLAAHWRAYLDEFTDRRHQLKAAVRVSAAGLRRLRHLMEPAVVRAVDASAGPPDDEGWVTATLPIESVNHAHEALLRLGAEVEVLTPPRLREVFSRTAAELARRYGASTAR
jgi:predicted DNA-binding transcriptional regulator YafY